MTLFYEKEEERREYNMINEMYTDINWKCVDLKEISWLFNFITEQTLSA